MQPAFVSFAEIVVWLAAVAAVGAFAWIERRRVRQAGSVEPTDFGGFHDD